jgi:uncharacterized repeat protein (TIGR01451 family)
MKKALLLAVLAAATLFGLTGTASAACVVPYCPSPTASATGASNVTTTSATLNGAVNTNGGNAASWTITLNGAVVGSGTIPDGFGAQGVSANAAGLTPGTTYSYTVTVTNSGGSAASAATFTTTASAPSTQPTGPTGGGDTGTSEPSTSGVTEDDAKKDGANQLGVPQDQVKINKGFSNSSGFATVNGGSPSGSTSQVQGSQVIVPGGTTTFTFGAFTAGEPVSFTLSGEDPGSASLALRASAAFQWSSKPTKKHKKSKPMTFKLKGNKGTLNTGDTVSLQLKMPKKVRQALKQGKTLKAVITLVTHTEAGTTRVHKTYKLKLEK